MNKGKLTERQEKALKWLFDRGGSGVINNYGQMLASGEVCRETEAVTWLRLLMSYHLGTRDGRIFVSWAGECYIKAHLNG